MDNQRETFSPCPKCDGERIDTYGPRIGLEYHQSMPLVCLSCGYIEFYATPETLEKVKAAGSYLVQEKAWAEAKARRAEEERLRQLEKPQKRFVWRRSYTVVVAILAVVIVLVSLQATIGIPGFSRNLKPGEAVTDHGLFMQVHSISFYGDNQYLMAAIKLQNMGSDEVNVVFGNEADGKNVLLAGAKFPGLDSMGYPATPNNLPGSYQSLLLFDGTLHPGATMEGLVFFAYVQDGQKATSIHFWHSVENSPFNYYDWTVPQ